VCEIIPFGSKQNAVSQIIFCSFVAECSESDYYSLVSSRMPVSQIIFCSF